MNPEPATASRFAARTQRALQWVTWCATLAALALLVVGLRDTPRRSLPEAPVLPQAAAGVRTCVVTQHPDQKPIAQAHVFAYSEQADGRFARSAEVYTDASGRACFELPAGLTWLLAEAERTARASTQFLLTTPRTVNLVLPAASAFETRVHDDLNVPLPKATVLVIGSDPLPYGQLTDASGVARFPFVVAPPWRVEVHCAGYESVTRHGVTSNLDVALRRLAALDVRVVNAQGAPAGGANVLIVGSALWPARRAQADAAGVAKIRGLSAGSYDLQANLGDAVSAPVLGFQLERGAEQSLELKLEPGLRVTAEVVDADADTAQPVANADVVLVEAGLGSFPHEGRTGGDGRVSLGPIFPGPATLAARHPDYVAGQLVTVPDRPTAPVRVALQRGAVLRGEVVDARGAPIGGASIEVVGTDRFGLPIAETPQTSEFRAQHFAWTLQGVPALVPAGELGVMPGPVPPIPRPGAFTAVPLPRTAFSDTEFTPWVTRDTGQFEAKPVTPGRVRAMVRHPAYVEGASDFVVLAPGGSGRVRVVLLRGGGLEGRVLDTRGFPVAGAEVEVVAERGTFQRSTITASDGAFAFAAAPEQLLIRVNRPDELGRVALQKRIKVPEGGRETIELVIPEPRESVRIVVVDERDAPIELAEVRITSLDPDVPLRSTLFTDAQGVATLKDARGVALRVMIEAPRFSKLNQALDSAGAELRFQLDPGVQVSGQVTAVRGRRSVAGALVTLHAGAERRSTMSDRDGAYRFASVPPGRVELSASHPDYADATLSAEVERTARGDRPFELPALDLADPAEIEGEVLDAAGNPRAGVRVSLGAGSAYVATGALPRGTAQTDAQGRFTLRGVPPGNVRISATATDGARGSAEVQVDGGRSARGVSIRLRDAAAAGEDGAPASLAVTLGERGQGAALEVVLAEVATSSEAERSGLLAGDILVRVDGERVTSMADARSKLGGREGSDVVVEVLRAGASVKLRVGREAVRR